MSGQEEKDLGLKVHSNTERLFVTTNRLRESLNLLAISTIAVFTCISSPCMLIDLQLYGK